MSEFTAEVIREYGITAIQFETITQTIADGKVTDRVIERSRVEFVREPP